MDGFKHRYLDARQAARVVDRAYDRVGRNRTNDPLGHDEIVNAPSLKYSSPWPWALALGVSLSMWAGLVWLVRLFV